mmetsp:Transcript_8057/g.36623  ORF Transcript_8057/g.36623 Transcript_8057/m.36623 type:complete len:346 (+) Transcript_8057:1300-2337(+)
MSSAVCRAVAFTAATTSAPCASVRSVRRLISSACAVLDATNSALSALICARRPRPSAADGTRSTGVSSSSASDGASRMDFGLRSVAAGFCGGASRCLRPRARFGSSFSSSVPFGDARSIVIARERVASPVVSSSSSSSSSSNAGTFAAAFLAALATDSAFGDLTLFRGESGGLPVPRGETGGVFFSPPLLLSMDEWGLSAVSSRGRKSEASDILLSSRVLSNVPESPNASAVRNIPFPPFFPVPSPPPMPARFSGFTSGFLDASSDAPDASPEASLPAGVSNLSELVVPLRWKLSTREKSSSRSTVVSIAPSLAAATAAACLGLRRLPRDRVPVWWSNATESGDF